MKENNFYETDIPLQEFLEKMRKNTYYNYHNYSNSSINKDFLNLRPAIFKVLQKVSMKMGFKSQTYFLSSYYLDIIFMKKKKININLFKIGLASLCLAAKFCENDPNVPQLQYFIRAYNNVMSYKNIISMSDLMYAEVLVCKLLNYKLNYYTIYDFNSFFFCHGILKFEQIKEIENDFKKRNKKKDFNINSLFVRNILGKIYKKSRDYLDIIIKMPKICLKYSPLYITILILEKSIRDILKIEYDKNCPKVESDDENENKKLREEFFNKNYFYFKLVMNDFYKIDYDSSEQYKQLIVDEELENIFKESKKRDKKNKKNEKEKDNIVNKENKENDDKTEKSKLLNSTIVNGFYKRLKIPLNNDLNKTCNTRNSITLKSTNTINNTEDHIDGLDSNLNINEFKKLQGIKNGKISNIKKLNKVPISRINTFNDFDNTYNGNKNKNKDKNITNENIDVKKDSNSPLKFKKMKSNRILNVKKINKKKKTKFNRLNEKVNSTFDDNQNNIIKNINTNIKKKPYLKKLITFNNKENSNSIPFSIKACTTTHFYSSKINQIPSSNTQNGHVLLKSENINTHGNENSKDKKADTYLSSFYNRANFKNKSQNKKFINTSIGERYKKKIKNNLNNIYRETKNENILIDDNNNSDKCEEKEKIKSTTGENFYPSQINRISVNIAKEPEIKNLNINKELKTKKLSLILSKKNAELNNTLKEINKSLGKKNRTDVSFKKRANTIKNNINENEINLYVKNKNDNPNNIKKVDFRSKKFFKGKEMLNKNLSITVNAYKNKKILPKESKNISINIPNNNSIIKKLSFGSNINFDNINNSNDGSLTSRENKIKNSEIQQDKFQSSIYQIIKKTKDLFSYNKKEEEDLIEENKKMPNNNFYKSQQNFYKPNDNKEKNAKNTNDEKKKDNTYVKNVLKKMKINNAKSNFQKKKNPSTIIINNNININIATKTKNVKIPQLNLSNAILNTKSNYNINNKCNTQRNNNINNNINISNNSNTTRKTINNIFQKLPFNKKFVNKQKKSNI